MEKRMFLAAGAATVMAAVGWMFLGRGAAAENVTLEELSGTTLASDPGLLVVDIRQPEEWKATGVIEGALLVPYDTAETFLKTVTPHLGEGQRLALICRSGNRTSRAARQIAGLVGFDVIDVQGGMLRVLKEGYTPVAPTRELGCQTC